MSEETISIEEMRSDLGDTANDLLRLRAIVENLRRFILESGGEDRSSYRVDLMRYEGLLRRGEQLYEVIRKRIEEAGGE